MSLKTWDGTQWVDTAAAHIHDTYLQLIGGSMTGDITLVGDPTQPLHPATKQYVDGIQDGLHTIATEAPAGPNIGDVWVNPDAVDENAYLPLNGTVAMLGDLDMGGFGIDNVALLEMDGSINFPAYGTIGLEEGNQGVSLNLGDRVSGLSPIPFIDFYGGTSVIAARIILRDQETGASRSGGLKYEASQGHLFVGPILAQGGSAASPTIRFADSGNDGLGMYLEATGQGGISAAGIRNIWWGSGFLYLEAGNFRWRGIDSWATTTNAPNVYVFTGTGVTRRYTSSQVHKRDIHRDLSAVLAAIPIPPAARWKDAIQDDRDIDNNIIVDGINDDTEFIGYVAEDWDILDGRFVIRNQDTNAIDNIHDRSIMAVLGEHIRTLEAKVEALENP